MNRAVFLDRDGTISKDIEYCRRPEDFELLAGAAQSISLLNREGFKVVVVTNQSGIARGYFNEGTLGKIHQKMRNDLSKYGANIDAIYYCPHHPDEGCGCRKPQIELGLQAIHDLDVDPTLSFFIGNRLTDILFASNLGLRSILILNKKGLEELIETNTSVDYTATDIEEATKWILSKQRR